jgi:hypothetical protein
MSGASGFNRVLALGALSAILSGPAFPAATLRTGRGQRLDISDGDRRTRREDGRRLDKRYLSRHAIRIRNRMNAK